MMKIIEYHIFKPLINIFHPHRKPRLIWNTIIYLINLVIFVFIPFEISLNQELNLKTLFTFHIVASIFTTWDLVCSMSMSYFENGFLIENYMEVVIHYLKNEFIIDLISLLAISSPLWQINYYSINFTLFFYLKLFKQEKLTKELIHRMKLDRLLQGIKIQKLSKKIIKGYIDILKIIIVSMFLVHFIACIWLKIGMLNNDNYNWIGNLIKNTHIDNPNWVDKYIFAVYWACSTMMTVGYGDITPVNRDEVIFTLTTIMFGCVLYGYNLNTIGMVIEKIQKETNIFRNNMKVINNYMDKKNIGFDLKMRIEEYLKFIWKEKKNRNQDEELKIINSLSSILKEELLLEAYGGILKAYPLFYTNFSEKSLKKMVSVLKEVTFTNEEIIFNQDDYSDCSMYFINKGEIELFISNDKPSIFKILKEKKVFGEIEFFNSLPRKHGARSRGFSNLYILKRKDFIDIIKEEINDYERFCMIKDQILLNDNNHSLCSNCLSCGSKSHDVFKCGIIHYIPDREKIIKSKEFNIDQPRKSHFNRKNIRKYNALSKRFLITMNQGRLIKEQIKENESKQLNSLKSFLKREKNEAITFTTVQLSQKDIPEESNESNSDYIQDDGFVRENQNSNNELPSFENLETYKKENSKMRSSSKHFSNNQGNLELERENSFAKLESDTSHTVLSIIDTKQKVHNTFVDLNLFEEICANFNNYFPNYNVTKQLHKYEKLRAQRFIKNQVQNMKSNHIKAYKGLKYMYAKDVDFEKKEKFSKYSFFVGNFNLINKHSKTNVEIKSPTHKSRFFKNNEFIEKKDFSQIIQDLVKGNKKK